MADEVQLDLLKRGVEAWNDWRTVVGWPFLRVKINFTRAYLAGAHLLRANLSEADLTEADLTGADLTDADLTDADLTRATLTGADLSRAIFDEADLRAALFNETVLSNVDLSSCLNLETVFHNGPSAIDFRTLQRSGPLSLAFLARCRVVRKAN